MHRRLTLLLGSAVRDPAGKSRTVKATLVAKLEAKGG